MSYSNDLAANFSNQFRTIVTSDWYRELFPNMCIDPRKNTVAPAPIKSVSLDGDKLVARLMPGSWNVIVTAPKA